METKKGCDGAKRVLTMLPLLVCDGRDGHNDGGGATRADLAEALELLVRDGTRLHVEPLVAGELHEHDVGDGWENRAGARGAVRAVSTDADKVGDRELLNVFLLRCGEGGGGAGGTVRGTGVKTVVCAVPCW